MTETIDPSPLEFAASALAAAGYAAYTLTLVGHAAPIANAYRERVSRPEEGDLVLETSTFHSASREGCAHDVIGTLVRRAAEHIVVPPDEWQTEGWEYDEVAWYVKPLAGGDVVRWTNADFVAIPRDAIQVLDWQGRA